MWHHRLRLNLFLETNLRLSRSTPEVPNAWDLQITDLMSSPVLWLLEGVPFMRDGRESRGNYLELTKVDSTLIRAGPGHVRLEHLGGSTCRRQNSLNCQENSITRSQSSSQTRTCVSAHLDREWIKVLETVAPWASGISVRKHFKP